MKRIRWAILALAPLAMAPTCDAVGPAAPSAPSGSDGPGPNAPKPVPGVGCRTYLCPGHDTPFACGDCIDNDGDEQIDYGWDQNCTGACDDSESDLDAFVPGAPPVGCRVECYFDAGVGGAEACTYDLRCDPREPRAIDGGRTRFESCEYVGDDAVDTLALWGDATCADLADALDDASDGLACSTSCGELTPPGCDCFGCCELPARSGNFVYLGTRNADGEATCTYEAAEAEFAATGGDPGVTDRACRLCTQSSTCRTPCEPGERCFGETIPPVCLLPEPPLPGPNAPHASCPPGTDISCVDHADCDTDEMCMRGCCLVIYPL